MPKPKLVPISNKETPPALVKPEFNNKLSNYNYTLNNAIYKNIYDLKYKYASYNKRAKLLDLAYECKLINKSDKRYLYQVLNEGAEKVRHSGAVFELKDGSNIQVTVLRTSRPLYNNKENILIGTYINKDGQQK